VATSPPAPPHDGADHEVCHAEAPAQKAACWARHDADRSASSPAGPSAAPTRKSGAARLDPTRVSHEA